MAGKSNTSATFFAQKKLLGKAHTSNLKVDGEEVIGSNIQAATSLLFGEKIPESPSTTDYVTSSAPGSDATVEYIPFILTALTGTTYDANDSGGGAGSDSSESLQTSGPHAYKFVLPSDYESQSSSSRAGNGVFNNDRLVHESLGGIQLVPPFFSQDAPNPYNVKIYKDDGGGGIGDEIPLLDNIDWNVDYYNGILFLQDYDSNKLPAFARAFAYIGKMADEVISSGSSGGGGGSGDGDASAEYVLTTATGSLANAKVLEAGSGISIITGSNTVTISSDVSAINGRSRTTYFVTASHSELQSLDISGIDFSDVSYDSNKIDVLFNGQLLHTGSSSQVNSGDRDYYLSASGSIVFGFDLENEDIIDAVISVVGEGASGGGGEVAASYLVLANTGSLTNERAFVAGNGLSANDAGANSNYTLSIDDSIVATLTSSAVFSNGISGSLTQLSDGSSYLIAGDNITIVSSSNGSITINSTVSVPSREKQTYDVSAVVSSGSAFSTSNSTFSDAGYDPNAIDIFLNGQLLMSGTDSQVGLSQADYFLFSDTELKFGFDLNVDDIVNVVMTPTGSSGSGGSGGSGTTYTAGTGLILNGTEFSIDDSVVTTLTSSAVFTNGLSGSLTHLADGSSYLVAGDNITITTASIGQIYISSSDTNTTYTAGDGLSLVGTEFSVASSLAGAGLTESSGVLAVVNGTNGGLFVDANSVSLNLANLAEAVVDVASDSIAIIDADGFTTRRETIADLIDATAGTGINAASGVLSIDDSVVATISGSQFSGNVGITGSLGIESTTIFNGGIHENFETKSAATGVVTHDCSTGHIFFHSGSTSNFTANFTNLNLATAYATNLTLLVTQSATAYIPSAIQIEGSAQTLMWQGGSAPSGTSNGQDVVSFSILNNSGSYVVLGQLVGFS